MPQPPHIRSAELDALVRLSRRSPLREAALAFTTVWGVLAVTGAMALRPWFALPDGTLPFERIGGWLVLSGILAMGLCWLHWRIQSRRVAAARNEIRARLGQADGLQRT